MKYETVHKLVNKSKHWTKVTFCIDDTSIVDSQYHQTKGSTSYEKFHNLLTTNIEVNLPAVLMVWIVDSQYH